MPVEIHFQPGLRPVLKHAKHDQSTHGNGGRGRDFAGGFREMSQTDRLTEARARMKRLTGNDLSDDELAPMVAGRIFRGPNNTSVTVNEGDSPKISDDDLDIQFETIATLQRIAPVDGLGVVISDSFVDSSPSADATTMAWVSVGGDTIAIRPRAITQGVERKDMADNALMPVLQTGNGPKQYTITHEYGHVLDKRDEQRVQDDFADVLGAHQTGMSRYAQQNGYEAFAESWVAWVGSQGTAGQKPGMVQYFAEKYGWDAGGPGRMPSAGVAKVDSVRIVLEDFKNGISTVIDAPSEVVKHGSHNQQSHAGRRASSTADLLERYTSDHRAMVEAGLKPSKLVARLGGAVGDFQRRTENLLERRGLKRRRGPKTYTREEAEALRRQYAEKYGPRTRMTFRGGSDLRPASLRDQAGDWRD